MDSFVNSQKRKRESDQSEDGEFEHKPKKISWRHITAENLDCDYVQLFNKSEADKLLKTCEENISYLDEESAQVFVFGKWHKIPRKQVAFGEEGLSYKFSGKTVPARPWPDFVKEIKDQISELVKEDFNFVLVNRYKDGQDYIGEHRDDEDDLVSKSSIASLSLGQPRDFIFRHADSRGKNAKRKIDPIKIELAHGSLLMMKYPTNQYWYHSLPPRKRLGSVRINMTFRKMRLKK